MHMVQEFVVGLAQYHPDVPSDSASSPFSPSFGTTVLAFACFPALCNILTWSWQFSFSSSSSD